MTTDTTGETQLTEAALSKLEENFKKIEELTERLGQVMMTRQTHRQALDGPNQELFAKATQAYFSEAMTNPAKLMEHQMGYWTKTLTHFMEAQQALAKGTLAAPQDRTPADRRFSNPLWETHPYFNFVKQQYLINAQSLRQAVEDVTDLDPREKNRLSYFSRQIIDMMSPTNFLATNPDALERAIETEGESLVKGIENLISDLEANDGELIVRLADEKAFKLGENIATMPGKVVYRNSLFELIQYTPTTEKVHKTPLIVFPPWINKFYILDLKAQNSFVKWVVDQGYTLFMVSWVNPDSSYRDVGMADYIETGYLAAIEEVKKITKEARINAVGYCIAGTTLAMVLSLLKKRRDASIKSATFFTALTDFSDQGEFQPFLTDDFIDGIEGETQDKGILPSIIMARTFSFLRSNDLVYGPAVKHYMMGETPPRLRPALLERGRCQPAREDGDGVSSRPVPAQRAGRRRLQGSRSHARTGRYRRAPVCRRLRDGPHRALEGQLSRRAEDGVRRQDFHNDAVRAYRRHREPPVQEEIRALYQRGP